MRGLLKLMGSSIGAKVVMALTGAGLALFVLQHMIAQWLLFGGPEAMNGYAHSLKHDHANLVWTLRGVLILGFVLHIASWLRLAVLNRAARPVGYIKKRPLRSTLASRTMVLSGLVVLAYLAYHLLHFTLGQTNPEQFQRTDALGRHDVYGMMVLGFQDIRISAVYIVANILLGLHLSHGVSSMFQSLGLNTPRYNGIINKVGPTFAVIVTLGFLTIPVSVLTGLIHLQP